MSNVPAPDALATGLAEGAQALVEQAAIRAGQVVVIHVDPAHDNAVVPALEAAVAARGARVRVLRTAPWDKLREAEPEALRAALLGADILIGQGEYLRAELPYLAAARLERGLLFINNEAKTPEAMASNYALHPTAALAARGAQIAALLAGAERVRVTTPAGTDLTFRVRPETIGGYWYPWEFDAPGHKKGWPGGILCFWPEDAEGVVCLRRLAPAAEWTGGPRARVLCFTVAGGRVTAVEGDGAPEIEALWARHGANARAMAKVLLGLHPEAGARGARNAASPASVNFGFGDTTRYGGPEFSPVFVQGFDDHPTVTTDGVVLYEGGRIVLPDPGLPDLPPPPALEAAPLPPAGTPAGDLARAVLAVAGAPALAGLPVQVADIRIDGALAFSVATGGGPARIGRRTDAPTLLRSVTLDGTAGAWRALLGREASFTDLAATGRLRLSTRLYGGGAITRLLTLAAGTP